MIFGPRMTERHVLRRGTSRGQVEHFADQRGWSLIAGLDADIDAGTEYERIWLTETSITLHYIEDGVTGHGYVFLAGDDHDARPGFEAELVAGLDVQPWPELIEDLNALSWGPDRGLALLRAAIRAPEQPDANLVSVIDEAFQAEHPDLRKIGILAASYPAWPLLRTPLRQLAGRDPDEEVREMAAAALRAFDREGVPDHQP